MKTILVLAVTLSHDLTSNNSGVHVRRIIIIFGHKSKHFCSFQRVCLFLCLLFLYIIVWAVKKTLIKTLCSHSKFLTTDQRAAQSQLKKIVI